MRYPNNNMKRRSKTKMEKIKEFAKEIFGNEGCKSKADEELSHGQSSRPKSKTSTLKKIMIAIASVTLVYGGVQAKNYLWETRSSGERTTLADAASHGAQDVAKGKMVGVQFALSSSMTIKVKTTQRKELDYKLTFKFDGIDTNLITIAVKTKTIDGIVYNNHKVRNVGNIDDRCNVLMNWNGNALQFHFRGKRNFNLHSVTFKAQPEDQINEVLVADGLVFDIVPRPQQSGSFAAQPRRTRLEPAKEDYGTV